MRERPKVVPQTLAAGFLLALLGGVASAKQEPEFGPAVDAFCQGRPGFEVLPVLGAPYTVGTPWPSPGTSCAGCHTGYPGLPPGAPFYGCDPLIYGIKCELQPQFDWWKAAKKVATETGTAPDFSAFCPSTPMGNNPPVLDPIGSKTVNENQRLAFLIRASDPDGDSLRFDGANLPTGATLTDNGNGTASFGWTPTYAQAGSFDVTFVVTDAGVPMASDSEQITITVGDVNRAPTLDPIGNRTGSEGVPLTIALRASDPDGDALRLEAANAPTGANLVDYGNGSALFSWTPAFGQTGGYPVSFIVTDDGVPMRSDSEQITITVGDVNRPPTLDPIGNRTVKEGASLAILLTASDPDGDTLHFEAAGLPPGAMLLDRGNGTGQVTWTPTFDQAGNHDVTVIVTDDGVPIQSDSEQITITVGDVNRPPMLYPIGNRTGKEGEPLTIALTGSDPDGDDLSFSATGLPSGALLADRGDSAELTWTPMPGQAGNYPVRFSVADDGTPVESDSEEITVSVAAADLPPANRPPVLDPVGDRTVREGETLLVTLTASDPDGGKLSFAVDGLPADGVLSDHGDGSAEYSWTPGPQDVGDYAVTCSVTDDGSPTERDSETIVVRVAPAVMDPPTGYLEIRRARWSAENSRLEVRGQSDPYAQVKILAAGSYEVLGEVTADEEGKYALNARPYVVPCAVEARTGDAYAGPVPVENAPQECGQAGYSYLRIKEVEWNCARHELRVLADHAPDNAEIAIYDADTNELLGTARADRSGRFDYRVLLEAAPSRIGVGVLVGDQAWLGEPVKVLLGDGCGPVYPPAPEPEEPPRGGGKGRTR
jgi:hypothetical protein